MSHISNCRPTNTCISSLLANSMKDQFLNTPFPATQELHKHPAGEMSIGAAETSLCFLLIHQWSKHKRRSCMPPNVPHCCHYTGTAGVLLLKQVLLLTPSTVRVLAWAGITEGSVAQAHNLLPVAYGTYSSHQYPELPVRSTCLSWGQQKAQSPIFASYGSAQNTLRCHLPKSDQSCSQYSSEHAI